MSAVSACPNCDLINPPEAVVCDCGYDFVQGEILPDWHQASSDDSRDFVEKHAGKILLSAFIVPIPLRLGGMNLGAFGVTILADVLFVLIVLVAIAGYMNRRKRR